MAAIPLHRIVGLCGLENLDTLRLSGGEELFIKRCQPRAAGAGAVDIGRIIAREAIALGDSDYIREDLRMHGCINRNRQVLKVAKRLLRTGC